MSEVLENAEEIQVPPVVEYDEYVYTLPNGIKQTIKYTKGNIQEALDVAARNHSEQTKQYLELKKEIALGKARMPDDTDVEKFDYTSVEFKPRDLTADEQWTVINHPGTKEALRLQSQAQYGADPEVVAATLRGANKDVREMRAQSEAQAFSDETPEWKAYATPENGSILVNYVAHRNWAPTKANFARAFKDLQQELSPRQVPTVSEVTPPNPQVEKDGSGVIPNEQPETKRPVITNSGLNRHNSSPTGGTPVTSRAKWTVEQVDKMSGTEYDRHYNGPDAVAFRKFVNDNC